MKRCELGSLLFKFAGMFLIWGGGLAAGRAASGVLDSFQTGSGAFLAGVGLAGALALIFAGGILIAGSEHMGFWIWDEPEAPVKTSFTVFQIVFLLFIAWLAIDLATLFLYHFSLNPVMTESHRPHFVRKSARIVAECMGAVYLILKSEKVAEIWGRVRGIWLMPAAGR